MLGICLTCLTPCLVVVNFVWHIGNVQMLVQTFYVHQLNSFIDVGWYGYMWGHYLMTIQIWKHEYSLSLHIISIIIYGNNFEWSLCLWSKYLYILTHPMWRSHLPSFCQDALMYVVLYMFVMAWYSLSLSLHA